MNPDGSGQTKIFDPTPFDSAAPAWSADGERIVFGSNFGTGTLGIFVMNADGSGATRLTSASDDWPCWSPDGKKIVFQREPPRDIYVMNADGTGQTILYDSGNNEYCPVWSPDGYKIAFERFDPTDGNTEICVINADGSNPTPLTNPQSGYEDLRPDWSPDGKKIAFARAAVGQGGWGEIWVMNADGSSQNPLTTGQNDGGPAWSPDGSKIVFERDTTQEQSGLEIFVMNADGSGQTRLTNNAVEDVEPDWQPMRAAVGGVTVPVNKLAVLAPYLALVGLVGAVTAAVATKRRRKT